MDWNTCHFRHAWFEAKRIIDSSEIHLRIETPLTRQLESMESPVIMVSCSLVKALVRRVKRVASAATVSKGTMSMRLELVASRRTSKYDEPERRPMTRLSQFFLSLELYRGMVKDGVGVMVLIRSTIMDDSVPETAWAVGD